jgi:tetratricopeptide (TPR) repeat protein
VPLRATPQELVDFFTKILAKEPTDSDALLERASAYSRLRNFDAAAADLTKALKAQPEHPLALVMMAQAELMRGHQEDAIQAVQRLVRTTHELSVVDLPRRNGAFLNARLYVVNTLLNTGGPEAIALGIELAEWTVKLLPNEWLAHNWLAENYYHLERWDDAAREFEIATPGATKNGQPYIPWLNLAMIEHRRGNPAKAQEYLETFKKWRAENQGKYNPWSPVLIDALQKQAEDLLKEPPGESKKP